MAARKNVLPIYPTLEAQIAERGIKKNDIAEALNITPRGLSHKLVGKVKFALDEAIVIKQKFFPDIPIEQLFYHERS